MYFAVYSCCHLVSFIDVLSFLLVLFFICFYHKTNAGGGFALRFPIFYVLRRLSREVDRGRQADDLCYEQKQPLFAHRRRDTDEAFIVYIFKYIYSLRIAHEAIFISTIRDFIKTSRSYVIIFKGYERDEQNGRNWLAASGRGGGESGATGRATCFF